MSAEQPFKKNITLINISPPYGMEASTLKLASSYRTSSVLQVLVCEEEILVQDLLTVESSKSYVVNEDEDKKKSEDEGSTKEEKQEKESKAKPIEFDFLTTIIESSHTVVIPDAMFSENSRVFHTKLFLEHGLEALGDFYKQGGTVIVMCMEGLFAVDQVINKQFGTTWKIQFFENGTCSMQPTETGHAMLGRFAPKAPLLKDNPHFIECPVNEGLYEAMLQNKEEFEKSFRAQDVLFERLGIEPDLSMDCFNIEKSWEKYLERYKDRFCVAVHTGNGSEGSVVWWGDRGQSDNMAFVFCKMLDLVSENRGLNGPESDEQVPKFVMNWGLILSILVVLVAAVVAQFAR